MWMLALARMSQCCHCYPVPEMLVSIQASGRKVSHGYILCTPTLVNQLQCSLITSLFFLIMPLVCKKAEFINLNRLSSKCSDMFIEQILYLTKGKLYMQSGLQVTG